jgi:hypothetical protein
VTDRQRQRVRCVSRPRLGGQREQSGDHGGDLFLAGPARPGDGGLDLAGGVEDDRQPPAGRDQRHDPPDLRGAHRGAHVVLAEHPLHRDDVGTVLGHPTLHDIGHRNQPRAEVHLGRGTHDVDGHTADCPPGAAVDHAESAAGEPGVHTQYPHRHLPAMNEHPFES